MKRFHALEWEDLRWFPASWRDYGTDYLRFVATRFGVYNPILPKIERGISSTGKEDWVDCASGGGSGLISLSNVLKSKFPNLSITLTDFYPNLKAFERTRAEGGTIYTYETESIDAANLPPHLHGKFRTMFGSFHHFRPQDARKILQNAVDSNSPIGIFEPVGRNFGSFFSMIFVILNVLIFTPFIRPVRWQVLPFIYIIPLVPLYILWDGIASIFRTYSKKELETMISELHHTNNFEWEIGKTEKSMMPVYFVTGIPKKTPSNNDI